MLSNDVWNFYNSGIISWFQGTVVLAYYKRLPWIYPALFREWQAIESVKSCQGLLRWKYYLG